MDDGLSPGSMDPQSMLLADYGRLMLFPVGEQRPTPTRKRFESSDDEGDERDEQERRDQEGAKASRSAVAMGGKKLELYIDQDIAVGGGEGVDAEQQQQQLLVGVKKEVHIDQQEEVYSDQQIVGGGKKEEVYFGQQIVEGRKKEADAEQHIIVAGMKQGVESEQNTDTTQIDLSQDEVGVQKYGEVHTSGEQLVEGGHKPQSELLSKLAAAAAAAPSMGKVGSRVAAVIAALNKANSGS
eukprot:gene32064-16597_t